MSDDLLSEDAERQARELIARRTSPVAALRQAVPLLTGGVGPGLVVSVAYAAVSTMGFLAVGALFDWALAQPEGALASTGQVVMGIGGLLTVYGIIQFLKRHTASRASWFPALFALPLLLVGGGIMLAGSPTGRQLGPALFQMLLMPWVLVMSSIGGAACAIAWVRSAHEVFEGRAVNTSEVMGEVRSRLVEISGPHGARQHAVTIGLQLLVPGIFYMLQLAFIDMVAVLEPDRGAWKRSGDLTYRMRSRLFRLFALWWVLTFIPWAGIQVLGGTMAGLAPVEAMTMALVDPRKLPLVVYFGSELFMVLTTWLLTVALLVLYIEREAQVSAARSLKRHKRALAAQA